MAAASFHLALDFTVLSVDFSGYRVHPPIKIIY
jgi:hypothetical protein